MMTFLPLTVVVMVEVDRAGEASLRVVAVDVAAPSVVLESGEAPVVVPGNKGRKLCASCGTHAHWFAYSRLSTLPKYNQVVKHMKQKMNS